MRSRFNSTAPKTSMKATMPTMGAKRSGEIGFAFRQPLAAIAGFDTLVEGMYEMATATARERTHVGGEGGGIMVGTSGPSRDVCSV